MIGDVLVVVGLLVTALTRSVQLLSRRGRVVWGDGGMSDSVRKPMHRRELAAALEQAAASHQHRAIEASDGAMRNSVAHAGLRELTAGDAELARLQASEFVGSTTGGLNDFAAARIKGSCCEVRSLAHTLKSHAVLVNAVRRQELCRTVEGLAPLEQLAHPETANDELGVATTDVVAGVWMRIS